MESSMHGTLPFLNAKQRRFSWLGVVARSFKALPLRLEEFTAFKCVKYWTMLHKQFTNRQLPASRWGSRYLSERLINISISLYGWPSVFLSAAQAREAMTHAWRTLFTVPVQVTNCRLPTHCISVADIPGRHPILRLSGWMSTVVFSGYLLIDHKAVVATALWTPFILNWAHLPSSSEKRSLHLLIISIDIDISEIIIIFKVGNFRRPSAYSARFHRFFSEDDKEIPQGIWS